MSAVGAAGGIGSAIAARLLRDGAWVEACAAFALQRCGSLDVVADDAGPMTFEPIAERTGDAGAIDTPTLRHDPDPDPDLAPGAEVADRRDVGLPGDIIAAVVAFLPGAGSRFVTGTTPAVDGGRLARS